MSATVFPCVGEGHRHHPHKLEPRRSRATLGRRCAASVVAALAGATCLVRFQAHVISIFSTNQSENRHASKSRDFLFYTKCIRRSKSDTGIGIKVTLKCSHYQNVLNTAPFTKIHIILLFCFQDGIYIKYKI